GGEVVAFQSTRRTRVPQISRLQFSIAYQTSLATQLRTGRPLGPHFKEHLLS
ncbi:hypothetical protein LINGRAPRIM_LOCUS182, partial [Linum grandiflorum]